MKLTNVIALGSITASSAFSPISLLSGSCCSQRNAICHSSAYTRKCVAPLYSTTNENSAAMNKKFDKMLSQGELKSATTLLQSDASSIQMNKERILQIFNAIEERTKEAEENHINKRIAEDENINLGAMEYPPTSPARMEMTNMYSTLRDSGNLKVFGAASDGKYPAMGSKNVTPNLLEKITELSMNSLTPKPTNTLVLAGAGLAIVEGIVSLSTGINLNFLIVLTLFLGFVDKLIVNGAVFETITRIGMPEYKTKILRHEAGHFLCAYLLGCPVEGCVLSTWAALADPRFGGKRTTVNAGTSFFDPSLSDQINGREPLTRASIDRYSIIVMGGIAAEALNFGMADGGAGDEMALVGFLQNLNPRNGGAVTWDTNAIKTQARWGALQAVLLLRQYNDCYEALVDALERGGELGQCVYAIENAIAERGLPDVAETPLGYVVDQGVYGEWINTDVPRYDNANATPYSAPGKTEVRKTITTSAFASAAPVVADEEVVSLEELKRRMQDKLKDIDSQLEDL